MRGIPLKDVTSEEASLGFVRWTLPPGATVGFRARTAFDAIRLHVPGSAPLTATLTVLDLDAKTTRRDAVIVRDGTALLPLDDPEHPTPNT